MYHKPNNNSFGVNTELLGGDILLSLVNKPKKTLLPFSPLSEIDRLNQKLLQQFGHKFLTLSSLNRQIVSFQANKARPVYRWYKYKEAFSAALVEYLFTKYQTTTGRILDPFAGSGTTLFAASEWGINVEGIELLPIGQQIIHARKILAAQLSSADFEILKQWSKNRPWQNAKQKWQLPELRITKGAYPVATKYAMEKYVTALQEEKEPVSTVLFFALLCVLESISYTRKDGQYLRWDYRSGRRSTSKPFDKGEILDFAQAISSKIAEMVNDLQPENHSLELFPFESQPGEIKLYCGSCLNILPTLASNVYDTVITSPPYCNRYDYTRTYALELALLGVDEKGLSELRQQMLSCTVENRAKDLQQMNPNWIPAIVATDQQDLLQTILKYLEAQKLARTLNNNGIPRMVRGYFYEMASVIWECSRVLKPGASLFMVNDNVRYAGVSISVDMILSDIAEKLGFRVEGILVLPNGKGNSSQQMGEHGREPLRKCVYHWRKL